MGEYEDYEEFLAQKGIKIETKKDFMRPGIIDTINLRDGCVTSAHIRDMVFEAPYETEEVVGPTKDIVMTFYLPAATTAINYAFLNLYFPGLRLADYPNNSSIIYLPYVNKGCPSYTDGAFDEFIQQYYVAGTGADGAHYMWYRAFLKFLVAGLRGFKLDVCELKWLLASKAFAGAGANAQLSLKLHAINDYGTLDKDDWAAATQVDYGTVNVYTDTVGVCYTEDVKTRVQALIDAEENYAAFRFKVDEPVDVNNANNYRLDEPLLYCELVEDMTAALNIYVDNGTGYRLFGSYSADREGLNLSTVFTGTGKKRIKLTCSKSRRINSLLRLGVTIRR
jgi:hypothetical protein